MGKRGVSPEDLEPVATATDEESKNTGPPTGSRSRGASALGARETGGGGVNK